MLPTKRIICACKAGLLAAFGIGMVVLSGGNFWAAVCCMASGLMVGSYWEEGWEDENR